MPELVFIVLSVAVGLLTSVKSAEAQNIYWANGTPSCATNNGTYNWSATCWNLTGNTGAATRRSM